MCTTCGCGSNEVMMGGQAFHDAQGLHYHTHGDGILHSHDHHHDPAHVLSPAHAIGMDEARLVTIERDILAKNDAYARQNREWFADRGVFALNLVSSPGAGKTTLLVKTIESLGGRLPLAVIEGDQQTDRDAARIRTAGAPALQINTGKGCHLDAHMISHAVRQLDLKNDSLLLIENVGNLVCPASFDLGEAYKVVIFSVTEGEDKPLKYPDMFRAASLLLLNKCDLLPHLTFDVDLAIEYARRINPAIEVIRIAATRGDGMPEWLAWLEQGCRIAAAGRKQRVTALRQRIKELEAQLTATQG